MDQKEEKGSSGPKPRYVWDPQKLAWVEITEAVTEKPASEEAAAELKGEEVLEEAKAEARAEEVAGEAVVESAPAEAEIAGEAAVEGAPAEAEEKAGGLQYRGAGIRLLAFIVDAVVLLVILYLFNAVSGSQTLINTATGKTVNSLTWHQWVFIAILFVYFVGFWAWRGQTPGKMLGGAKIVKRDGSRIGIGRSLLRFIVYFLYLMVFGFAGSRLIVLAVIIIVVLMIIALNKKKQGLHDLIAGTVVIDSHHPKPELVEAEASDMSETGEASSASEESEPPGTSEPETDKTDQEK